MNPLVSCLLPTYNKFANKRFPDCTHLVEESIESFRRQTYEPKELILCNDCPGQTYECNEPDVTVINLPRRCRSLGEKLNFMAGVAKGDLLFRWDDDDIYLPWRLEIQTGLLDKYEYVTSNSAWWSMSGSFRFSSGSGFSQIGFRRKLFAELRGYSFIGVGEDMDFEARVNTGSVPDRFYSLVVNKETAFALYRWGTGSEHVSGYGNNGYEKMGETDAQPGHKVLEPHWKIDYVEKLKELCVPNIASPSNARPVTSSHRQRSSAT